MLQYYAVTVAVIDSLRQGRVAQESVQVHHREIHVPVPPFPEQDAIAAILSDMDAEIAALEAKLAKARQIKQGMMQELLTGRIRLPVDGAGRRNRLSPVNLVLGGRHGHRQHP